MNYRVCFAAYLRRQGRRESTVKSYVRALEEFYQYSEGQRRRRTLPGQMVPEQIEAYKQYLLYQRGLRPSTVNRRLSALSALARFLISRRMLNGNPLELVSRAGNEPLDVANLRSSWESVQRLRTEVHGDVINVRDRAIIELLYAGLTVRELCGLRYDPHWSTDNGMLEVGERAVTLQAWACLALEHYLILRPILQGNYLLVGKGADNSLKASSIYSTVRRLARLAGVKVGVKDLRLGRLAAEVFGFGATANVSAGVAA